MCVYIKNFHQQIKQLNIVFYIQIKVQPVHVKYMQISQKSATLTNYCSCTLDTNVVMKMSKAFIHFFPSKYILYRSIQASYFTPSVKYYNVSVGNRFFYTINIKTSKPFAVSRIILSKFNYNPYLFVTRCII